MLNLTVSYKLTKKSRVTPDAVVNKAFAWLWNGIEKDTSFPDTFHFYHEGRCVRYVENLLLLNQLMEVLVLPVGLLFKQPNAIRPEANNNIVAGSGTELY